VSGEDFPRKVRASGLRINLKRAEDESEDANSSPELTSPAQAKIDVDEDTNQTAEEEEEEEEQEQQQAQQQPRDENETASGAAPDDAPAADVIENKASPSWSPQELSIFRNSLEIGMFVGLCKPSIFSGDSWAQVMINSYVNV